MDDSDDDSDAEPALRWRIYGESLAANVTATIPKLFHRQMTLPHKHMVKFYKREFSKDNYQPVVWHIPNTQSGFNTTVFEEIGGGSKPKSLGISGLSGCTALIIASRPGVYIAHYVESLAIAPDDISIDHYGSEDACFESTVTLGLKNVIPGRGRTKKAQQVSLTENAAKLRAGGELKAYLIAPSSSWDGKVETYTQSYTPKFNRIKEIVGGIVPELKAPGLWTDTWYTALDTSNRALFTTSAGKLLFKYDPDHGKKGAKKKKAAL
ncbi:hypothetical protein BKA65DRAFT_484623 [Rhexocercosporidium sp. MPI-PUGE-AT-0058]|nr:hypothetical protein BKA65DRAFT_484623 [Rhexocercosporidium sp. MPI-PUGE-AT-0058]